MMTRINSVRILRATVFMVCLSILLPGLLWAAGAAGGDGEADFCPGTPERPTAFDPACQAGYVQMNGCANVGASGCGEPQTNGITCNNTNSCWAIPECGGLGERACCGGAECEAGLAQYFVDPDSFGLCDDFAGGCLCEAPNQNTAVTSSGYCQAVTACGGDGERACCPGEPERPTIGYPACEAGLVEQLGCFGPGCGCSSSTCAAPTACGGPGQRACCSGEPGRPTTADFACPNGNGVNLREVAADPNPEFFCGLGADLPGVLTNSVCEAVESCGGEGQRACCFGTAERPLAGSGCQAGLVEAPGCDGSAGSCVCGGTDSIISALNTESSGTCVQESSCGGIGERGCCIGDERLSTGACEAGLTEVPNGCTGNCYCGQNSLGNGALSSSMCISLDPADFPIAEPGTNCTPGSPGCPLRGYADMHVHMFGHLAHGGTTFKGQPYDELGGVNAALSQDAWTTADIEYAGAPRALVDIYGDPVPALNQSQCNEMNVLSLGGLTWTGTECRDLVGNRVVASHGGHGLLYDTIGAGSYDMAGNVDASNIDTPAGPFGLNAPFGAPAFNAWPTWTTTVHQQVYYKWLERAYQGGLRLMVMMAVNSEAACRTGNHLDDVDCKISMLPPDRLHELDRYNDRFELKAGEVAVNLPPIELQLQAAYKFESWLNQQPDGGWFKIVRSTEEARQAIADGKLAVVLGIEVDHLFNCHATNSGPNTSGGQPREACTEGDVLNGIDSYYKKGVRHIFPVHNFDNSFAGAAAWSNSLNVANRAMEGHWWEVEECPQVSASLAPPGDDGYSLKVSLGLIENLLLAIGFPEFDFICEGVIDYLLECAMDPELSCDAIPPDPAGCTSLITEQAPIYASDGHNTSCNQRGLTPSPIICPEGGESCLPRLGMTPGLGSFLIEALMDKGMLIDIDHMSIRSLNDTLDLAESRDYPLLASHVQFFELQKKFNDAGEAGRHERMRTREQLVRMANLGSLVAPVLQTDSLRTKTTLPYISTTGMPEISNDCRNSAKSWALTYQYAVDVLDGPVAVGSDWNGVSAHLGPRFGNQGCGGSATTIIGAFDPDDGGAGQSRAQERSAQEKAGNQLQYPFTIPGFGSFDRQKTGQKTFDFNYDGLAHVGMMPDMLGDLMQVGLREQDLNPLMRSAEAYVTLWEKADFIAGNSGDLGPGTPAECVDRVVPIGPGCTAVDVSIAVDNLAGNPDVTLTQFPPGPYAEGTHQVLLTVNRDNGLTCEAADFCEATVTVTADPSQCVLTADAGGPYTTPEGQSLTVDGSGSFDPNGSPGYAWDLDDDSNFDDATGVTASFTEVADAGIFNIGLQVMDEAGDTASDTTTVTVTNVAPSGLTFSATPVDENGSTTLTGSFIDPGTLDTFELEINWGDSLSAGNTQIVGLGLNRSFSINHQYLDDNPSATPSDIYSISVTVTDDDNGSISGTAAVPVNNVAPVVAAPLTSPAPSDEGSSVIASAAFTDVGTQDTHQCTVDYGDGSGNQAATVLNGVCTGAAHIYAENGQYTITVIVTDDDTGVGSNSSVHQVNNVAPVVAVPLTSPAPSDEGSPVIASVAFTDVGTQDTHQCTIDYGDGGGNQAATVLNGVCTGAAHIYAENGQYAITVIVTDDDTGVGSNSSVHQVNNVAPVVAVPLTSPAPSDEGSPVIASVAFTDVGIQDTHQCTVDYGDGSGNQTASVLNGGCTGVAHIYADNGQYTVTVFVTDDDGGVGSNSSVHQVDNVAPVISSISGDTINENGIATVSGTFSDAGTVDSFTVTIDWNAGAPEDFEYAAGATDFTETHQYLDDNPTATPSDTYGITVTVTDDDGGFASDTSADVIINNLAPEVGAIVVDSDLVPIGTEIMASASFTDTGTLDTHTAEWNWGDNSGPGTVTQTGNDVLVTDPHTYDVPGIYTIELSVTDDDTGSDRVIYQYMVVYDPDGPFVTGGGKIDSPVGAYAPDPSLTGMANFGFVSKYKKGSNVPTGNTEFQFSAAGLDFKSTEYEWLVVAGARAQFKGTGTIKGQSGSYRFFLTVIDGQVNGGGGSDKFRIRIWDAGDNSGIIYDNQMNSADDEDPTTVIRNGSIVIHKGKKN